MELPAYNILVIVVTVGFLRGTVFPTPARADVTNPMAPLFGQPASTVTRTVHSVETALTLSCFTTQHLHNRGRIVDLFPMREVVHRSLCRWGEGTDSQPYMNDVYVTVK